MHADQLHIAEPCSADWDQMTGDERRRFCGQCRKHVHDLNAHTEAEAEALVRSSDDLCVQYRPDADGTLRFSAPRPSRLGLLAVAATMFATPAFASGKADGAGILQSLHAWWNGEQVIAEVEASLPAGQPETTAPTTVIPELSTPVTPIPELSEPIDIEIPVQKPDPRPMIRGLMVYRPDHRAAEPSVTAALE